MIKTTWTNVETPIGPSAYMSSLTATFHQFFPVIRENPHELPAQYYVFCPRFATAFIAKFIANLYRCKLKDISKYQKKSCTFDQLVGLSDNLNKLDTYVELWESAKFPLKQSLKSLQEIINKQIGQIDQDHFVLGSEYLTTLLVVVPKALYKDWSLNALLFEDQEHGLWNVTVFNKVVDEFKLKARENKFVVRDFTYSKEDIAAGKSDLKKQYQLLICWLKVYFSESVIAWVHVKVLRLFVESVLRYGLSLLNQLYAHLDTSISQGPIEDIPGFNMGAQEYYPYISFKINIDFVSAKTR
ncbi:hypothetical protein TYRP_005493 [Tyrophagus putrescentiae]|nr:hypothetical protein TYRP_005493 [Tyrophagus putrescentiae]